MQERHIDTESQAEPAEVMGVYGMGPGSEDDKPLTTEDIQALVAGFEGDDG